MLFQLTLISSNYAGVGHHSRNLRLYVSSMLKGVIKKALIAVQQFSNHMNLESLFSDVTNNRCY